MVMVLAMMVMVNGDGWLGNYLFFLLEMLVKNVNCHIVTVLVDTSSK